MYCQCRLMIPNMLPISILVEHKDNHVVHANRPDIVLVMQDMEGRTVPSLNIVLQVSPLECVD